MAEAALLGAHFPVGIDAHSRAITQPQYEDKAILPGMKQDGAGQDVLEYSMKMLGLMGLIKEGQTLDFVKVDGKNEPQLKITGKDSEKAQPFEFSYLQARYRKLESEARKSRQDERAQIEFEVASRLGKTLGEMSIKFVDPGEDYLAKNSKIEVWTMKDGKHVKEQLDTAELIERLEGKKTSFSESVRNLQKVYKMTRAEATEKYVGQTALGKVVEKAFDEQDENTEALVKQAEALDAVPEEKKGFWHKLKRGVNAIKQTIDKPLAPIEATVKAVTGFALYDANPLRILNEKTGLRAERLWTDAPVSTTIPAAARFIGEHVPKLSKLKEAGTVTMREMAARLEEKLMIDPITGEGVRSGGITPDQIREASVEGAKWAVKMHLVPEMIAKIPVIKALAVQPDKIYSLFRSSKMLSSGAGSVKQFVKKFKQAKTTGEKAKLAAFGLGTGVSFYLAEKLSPTIVGGAVNPVLMLDVSLMRLAQNVEEYTRDQGLEKTELAEKLEEAEAAMTITFALDSANNAGAMIHDIAETGSANPVGEIEKEADLIKLVENHPEYLRGESGGVFGEIRALEHELISSIRGIESEKTNPWKTVALEDGTVYHVNASDEKSEPIVIKQTKEGAVSELHAGKWVEAPVAPEPVVEKEATVVENSIPTPKEVVSLGPVQAVHDYVYFEPDTTKMAFRMDLVPGETWESKVDRLFHGYGPGGIDDPSGAKALTGKEVQKLEVNSPELTSLTGKDGVYESQIHDTLITRLLTDAANNGLVYDQALVQARMVEFLKNDTTADKDTVEGEIDYAELYKNLFKGSEVKVDVAQIDTKVYQPYFISGNEGTTSGIEVNITIPAGGSVLGQLAEHGYGAGDGRIYDAQGNPLKDAQIFKIDAYGNEILVKDFTELDHVQVDDKFVVRTGIGSEVTVAEGKIPVIVPLNESKLSSFELPHTVDEAAVLQKDWEHDTVRNEAGEIYLGKVGEGSIFTQMMFDKFGGVMDNPWDTLAIFQNMEANGVKVYAEDAQGAKRYLNSYDDLSKLYVGEKIVVVDPNHAFTQIVDQDVAVTLEKDVNGGKDPSSGKEVKETDKTKDDWAKDKQADKGGEGEAPVPALIVPGFNEKGLLDLNNPPMEAIRDKEGYIYVGQIQDGTYLSMLMASHLPGTAGVDTWQNVNDLYESGKIEILKVDANGQYQKLDDINFVSIGDKIIIKDASDLLTNVKSVDDLNVVVNPAGETVVEKPIEKIDHVESDNLAVVDISARLEAKIAEIGSDVNIGLTVIDLDNDRNIFKVGNQEVFDAHEAQKLAIAMAVLRSVDSGALDLSAESKYVVLPGDYKPSIEHLLNLMLVQNDVVARDGLFKELSGQDLNLLYGEGTGLKEVMQDNDATTDEVAQLYKTLLRTNYLTPESRDLVEQMIKTGQERNGGLLSNDLSSLGNLDIVEMSNKADWAGVVGGEKVPEYSTFANVTTTDGRELVVVLTADSGNATFSRSAFRTVGRELIHGLGVESGLLPENEMGTDVAKVVFDNEQAKLDYVNHVISPYRMQNGDYFVDPIIEANVKDIASLDMSKIDKQVTTYADGSGVIQLKDSSTGRLVSVFVDCNQHVSMILDSENLKNSSIGYEVYPNSNETKAFSEGAMSADSDKVKLNVSLEIASTFDFKTPQDRINFVDVVKASGREYDFYVFVGDDANPQSTIMYGRDGSVRDAGSLSADVSVAIVSTNGYSQIDNAQADVAWRTLLDKFGTTKDVTDVVWNDQSGTYSSSNDTWDKDQPHWFDSLYQSQVAVKEVKEVPVKDHQDDADLGNRIINSDHPVQPEELVNTPKPDLDKIIFAEVAKDTLGIDVATSATSVMVDGINFTKTIYVPEGMELDRAVVARSNNINLKDIVIRPTSDANVYLVGEQISSDKVDTPEVRATFTHPQNELLYQYQGDLVDPVANTYSTYLSPDYKPTVEHPLLSVFPLERPIDTYLDTDRLVRMSEKEQVKLQYQGKPYFVLTDSGFKDFVYVDPYSMISYVKSGEDFIPLVADSYSYKEMAEIYGMDKAKEMDVQALWERRVVDTMAQEARGLGAKVVNEGGSLVIYDESGKAWEQVFKLVHDDKGNVVLNSKGQLVLESREGKRVAYSEGKFVLGEASNPSGIDQYLKDFESVTDQSGTPLQYHGFPILSKGDLLYVVSQEGVSLIGSKAEFNLEGYIADKDSANLLTKWNLNEAGSIISEPKTYVEYMTEKDKIIHGLAVQNDRLLEVKSGFLDLKTNETFETVNDVDNFAIDSKSGKMIFKNTESGDKYVWGGAEWVQVSDSDIVTKEKYLKDQGLTPSVDLNGKGQVVDRRTHSQLYEKDGWTYILDDKGLTRIGQTDAVLKAGFVGYLDADGNFQTFTPETMAEIHGNAAYTPAERLALLLNPLLNSVVGMTADITNVWADFELKDVLPSMKNSEYVSYEELPPKYIAALISQENKTLYRASDNEATNLDLGVLAKVILSGGDRGGSTLVQGLVKNLLISPEERMDRSLMRKVNEVQMADQLLKTMSVEEVVAMYANTVSFGSLNGSEISGISQASEKLFGKNVHELDLVETGLLVALPNFPNRNNLYSNENAIGWADSASGVYRHMYENGFITEAEMQQAFLDVHSRVLASGNQADIDYLLEKQIIKESDVEWVTKAADEYKKLGFDDRKLIVTTPANEAPDQAKKDILTPNNSGFPAFPQNNQILPIATPTVGLNPVLESPNFTPTTTEVEKVVEYADFFQYLSIKHAAQFTAEDVALANSKYYWVGKLPAGENVPEERSYLPLESVAIPFAPGSAYTTKDYVPEDKDYTPRVEIGDDHNVVINAWAHRYEAIVKDKDGKPVSYNVITPNGQSESLVQDELGGLWQIGEHGLIRIPGRVYQVESGGAVQAMPANDRPGMLFNSTGEPIEGAQFVRDSLGNYYKVIDDSKVDYVGQVMQSKDGRNVLFELDANPNFEVATEPKNFLKAAVENIMSYRGTKVNVPPESMPTSNDPNEGYVAPKNVGEYGLINPIAAEKYLTQLGVVSHAVELSASRDGKQVFEKYITELVSQDKPVLVWLNGDLSFDAMQIDSNGTTSFEAVSRFEKPVSVLQIFDFDGSKYVVYQDPTQTTPQVITFNRFAELASASTVGRYKTVVLGAYELTPELTDHLYDPKDQVNQVGVIVEDGYVYNYDAPGTKENMMSINPDMQKFVTDEAKNLLKQNGGSGFVGIAMGADGRIPFYVGLDADGNPDPKMLTKTYQPGSVYKLVTAMSALNSGVNPHTQFQAGDKYYWEAGDFTANWTIDAKTGLYNYASGGADPTMNMIEALIHSNNPYFLRLVDKSDDINALPDYARSVGFGDGKGFGNLPTSDSIVKDSRDGDYLSIRNTEYEAIGQGGVAIAPADMLRFVDAISNGGDLRDLTLSRELSNHQAERLPNKSTDYAIMSEAMRGVTSDPTGTAYFVFKDVSGYDIYGKTGTAEVGEGQPPNALFTGWAVDQVTGEKLSFIFLIPNGGEGSKVAAPMAKLVLDKYFSNLNQNKAMLPTAPERANAEFVVPDTIPTPNIFHLPELEKGVPNFNLDAQPNKDVLILATHATRIANSFVPTPGISHDQEGVEFVKYLKQELTKQGYGAIVESESMNSAFKLLGSDYKSYDPKNPEPIQCVAWERFLGSLNGVLPGAPIRMQDGVQDAVDMSVIVLSKNTGEALSTGGVVVRFADDTHPDITLMEPGDAGYVRYKGNSNDDAGHTFSVMAKAKNFEGQPIVLIADANRYVDENGKLQTDGKARLRWLTQAEFNTQYVREGDSYNGIAPSEFALVRLDEADRVQTVFDQNYHTVVVPPAPETDWLSSPDREWRFVSHGEDGNLKLPFENSVQPVTENVGTMKPIESIFIHWAGAPTSDPSTWTAESVVNGLASEKTSSTFAVGVDKIIQMARLTPNSVQETFATPWQHGAVNIEIAGEDFDHNPPSPEQYQKVVELVTELLITSNKPISIVQPHYKEIYLWSTDMSRGGDWVLIDSRDLAVAKYWDDKAGEKGDWVPLDQAKFTYDPNTLQSKTDPGEIFFAKLVEDVEKRLIALGKQDLADVKVVQSTP